jgi:hypothetical protein
MPQPRSPGFRRRAHCHVPGSALPLSVRSLRPSLLDQRFTSDAWIVDQGDGTLMLRLGDYDLAPIVGLPLDLPSLNQLFGRLRRLGRSG